MRTIEKIKSAIGLKVVGKVNLDEIPDTTRPVKSPKEEKEMLRQLSDLQRKKESTQRQIEVTKQTIEELQKKLNEENTKFESLDKNRMKLEYLRRKAAVREKYSDFTLTTAKRQKELYFNGVRPQKMDVVHFHVPNFGGKEEMDGVALVRDENHYYLAVDMYDQPEQKDNITTIMDENPDGTFDGIWPKHVVLKAASKFEERYMRNLVDQYADDLDKAETFITTLAANERKEIEELTAKMESAKEQLAAHDELCKKLEKAQGVLATLELEFKRTVDELTKYEDENDAEENTDTDEGSSDDGIRFDLQEPEYEPMEGLDLDTDIEKEYPHLPYLRGKRQMTTMNWPQIGTEIKPWLRFRLMANLARIIEKVIDVHALTYILSEEYFEELTNRGRQYYKSMTPEEVVPEGEICCGALVYPSQGFDDTIIYRIDRRGMMNMQFIYIRETRLMFYESYSVQEIIGNPRTDVFICQSMKDGGTDPNRLFSWIRNLVVSFLAMENDMERTVNRLVEEGAGSAIEARINQYDAVDTTDDRDIVIRDAAWYTDITVNRLIPVRGYISHRLCGSGKDKYIKEVWVRPHVKQGYHRSAGIKN